MGKIYNLLSFQIANKVYEQVSGISEIYVWLLSKIGQSIDQPAIAAAEMISEPGTSFEQMGKMLKK